MTVATKLVAYAAALAAVFGGAAVAGGAIDPDRGSQTAAPRAHSEDGREPARDTMEMSTSTTTAGAGADHGGGADDAHAGGAEHGGHSGASAVRGLAVADGGLQLDVLTPELRRGREQRVAFRILDADGRAVRDFDVEHEKRMHMIVVRRDLAGFQHVHPTLAADGTWSVPLRLDAAGSYRLFADFSSGGQARTLASDLRVDGAADLRPLPAPATVAASDGGDEVRLRADGLTARGEASMRFAIARDGKRVALEDYLGAGGHLVALREGDLAFLHVHPTARGDGTVTFASAFPTPGRYRLFLQYQVAGRVQTAAFTVEVAR